MWISVWVCVWVWAWIWLVSMKICMSICKYVKCRHSSERLVVRTNDWKIKKTKTIFTQWGILNQIFRKYQICASLIQAFCSIALKCEQIAQKIEWVMQNWLVFKAKNSAHLIIFEMLVSIWSFASNHIMNNFTSHLDFFFWKFLKFRLKTHPFWYKCTQRTIMKDDEFFPSFSMAVTSAAIVIESVCVCVYVYLISFSFHNIVLNPRSLMLQQQH